MIDYQLPYKDVTPETYGWAKDPELVNRLLYTNPGIYQHLTIHRYQRYQKKPFTIRSIFTHTPGECLCGCKKPITGKRRVWATDTCYKYAWLLYCIIKGRVEVIKTLIRIYQGDWCKGCGVELKYAGELDHIVPVFKGGGGCWLSNYQLLCTECHKHKTKSERTDS